MNGFDRFIEVVICIGVWIEVYMTITKKRRAAIKSRVTKLLKKLVERFFPRNRFFKSHLNNCQQIPNGIKRQENP